MGYLGWAFTVPVLFLKTETMPQPPTASSSWIPLYAAMCLLCQTWLTPSHRITSSDAEVNKLHVPGFDFFFVSNRFFLQRWLPCSCFIKLSFGHSPVAKYTKPSCKQEVLLIEEWSSHSPTSTENHHILPEISNFHGLFSVQRFFMNNPGPSKPQAPNLAKWPQNHQSRNSAALYSWRWYTNLLDTLVPTPSFFKGTRLFFVSY